MTSTLPRAVADRLSPAWRTRLGRPGYLLLPLRGFLGITFCYAGLQKLANPAYFDRHSPASAYAQMYALRDRSPIGPLLSVCVHAPAAVGLVIALGELAVGVGTLLGLMSRVAALGGALLSLTFFLTVSWNTSPYYYGSDIAFLFAWTVLIAFGSAAVLSLDAWLHRRARQRLGLRAESPAVSVAATRLRELCTRDGKCGMDTSSGACRRPRTCPVFAPAERLSPPRAAELDRRSVLATGAGVAGVGLATAFLAATTAAVGRAMRSSASPSQVRPPASSPAPRQPPSGTPSRTATRQPDRGTVIAAAADVPVGQAKSFLDPHSHQPAWLVHVSGSEFKAFSAVCTHAGCGVSFDPAATQFVCPCHGGTFDAKTGQVLGGPPPAPLPAIPVVLRGGEVSA